MMAGLRFRSCLAAAWLACCGCSGQPEPPAPVNHTAPGTPAPETADRAGEAVDSDPAEATIEAEEPNIKPPAAVEMPQVLLSGQHQESSKLLVGDSVPDLPLKTFDGSGTMLSELALADSPRLIVLAFQQVGDPYSEMQLQDLQRDFAEREEDSGVVLAAIHVGGTAEQARAAVETAGAMFPTAHDPQGAAFLELADGFLPRLYLLDSQRRILWFDIGHSRETRLLLKQAIAAGLEN